jgi:hypothetical protein
MNTAIKICARTLMLTAVCGMALAQQPAPPAPATPDPATKATAESEAGEPRANAVPAAGPAPAATTPVRPSTKAAGQKSSATDRLNLNTTTVTGDREQPKVMYVVPWKSANIGDLSGKPMNSLLDEALAPVDREEFRREVAYYDAVRAATPQNGAPAKQGEK